MEQQIPDEYYDALRRSADELFQLGMVAVPAMEWLLQRDYYNGNNELLEWRDSGFPDWQDPDTFGHQGAKIVGFWNRDGSLFNGFFPARICNDGKRQIVSQVAYSTDHEVRNQIELAQEYNLLLGLAAMPRVTIADENSIPNSMIFAEIEELKNLSRFHDSLRVETDGQSYWTYAYVNFSSYDIGQYFDQGPIKYFRWDEGNIPIGAIRRGGIQPCYPSIVLGTPVRKVKISGEPQILIILSASESGIDLDFDDDLYEEEDFDVWYDEDIEDDHEHRESEQEVDESLESEWSCDPDTDEFLFNEAVARYEQSTRIDKSIIRHGKPSLLNNSEHSIAKRFDLDLCKVLPPKLGTALLTVMQDLPYDPMCVLMAFCTGAASMLRLGTTVTGIEATGFTVPINLYTILTARSGRKKTPLQKLYIDEPAEDVLRRIASQNSRQQDNWLEKCKGKKKDERPPQPIPIDIRIQDYTSEAFVKALCRLDEVGRAVLVAREEISALFDSLNSYRSGKGSDEQQLLELYDGNRFRSLRVGDNSRGFERAAVSIYGAIQPAVLEALLSKGDDKGTWARFCFTPLPDITKKLPTVRDELKLKEVESAKAYMREVINAIFDLPAVNYLLDTEATEIFSDYEFSKQEAALGTPVGAQASLYGKSAGKVLRFAGILHVLHNVVLGSSSTMITSKILKDAILIIDMLDGWTLKCHAQIAGLTVETLNNFERRIQAIALKTQSLMSWTAIRNQMSSVERQGKTKEDAESGMRKLVALGLGKISTGPNGGLVYKALKPIPT